MTPRDLPGIYVDYPTFLSDRKKENMNKVRLTITKTIFQIIILAAAFSAFLSSPFPPHNSLRHQSLSAPGISC